MSQDHELVRRIHDLGAPYGLERSAKFEDGTVLDDRFLVSVHRRAFGASLLERVASIGAAFGMPAEVGRAFSAALEGADIVHFGFEGAAGSETYKIYFEYAERTRAAMAARDPKPTLVHLAFKWDRLRPGGYASTRYVWSPGRTRADIEARLRRLTPPVEAPRAMRCAAALLDRAAPLAQSGGILMMEVEEPGNPRRSWDLNVYDAELSLKDVADLIELVAEDFAAPRRRVEEALSRKGRLPLGHLSAGIGRGGKEFVTFYYGVESHRGERR